MRYTLNRALAAVAASAALSACSADKIQTPLEVNVTPEGAGANPTAALQLLAAGINATNRNLHDDYVRDVALFGREGYYFQLQDGRWITHYFRDYNDNTSFAVGNWAGRFTNLRNVNSFKTAVRAATSLSPAQVSAANGFALTEEALQVLYLVNTRHNLGTPVSVAEDPNALTPFVSRDSALRFVSGTLDAGYAALNAGGTAFPFNLPSAGGGFAGFTAPADYARYNRALKARVEAYRASLGCGASCYQAAAQALGQSFITATLDAGNLNSGPSYIFSAAAGDSPNLLWSLRNDMYSHMSIRTDASVPQTDARLSKVVTNTEKTLAGSEASSVSFNIYTTNNAAMPIIDNEELWLLKAEIEWFTGNQAAALTTLNRVATVAGGATGTRYAGITTNDAFVTALLAERRLSLLLEGHRWVDARRFNRLSSLPAGGPGFTVAAQQVVPQLECQARTLSGDAALAGPGCP